MIAGVMLFLQTAAVAPPNLVVRQAEAVRVVPSIATVSGKYLRADLLAAALHRPRTDVPRVGTREGARLLGALDVLGAGVAALQGPACATREHSLEVGVGEPDAALGADSTRTVAVERRGEISRALLDFRVGDLAGEQADPTADVITDRPR